MGRGGRRCEQIWADRAARCKSVRFTEKAIPMPRSRLKIGMLSRLFSRRPEMLWDVTTLVRPVTGNRSPDNRVSRSPPPSVLVSMHRRKLYSFLSDASLRPSAKAVEARKRGLPNPHPVSNKYFEGQKY
jgi:hypothetical protein